ncbi:asparagine synthase-related protein [Bacillus sp. FJAT-50079]|uniref:asparagine synthase-related protein n=1 Tax=Bacillus sp. FJAT-50079 TaxID=2833577 RepID=UPI001BC9012E|nr:asparagine synthase-related protein [Bacillus sp. FJAT-50079]MBS4209176.1 asparagine synthetase B [Bacillus sp. FJAT-50079]
MSAITGIYQFTNDPILLDHGNNLMKSFERFPSDDIHIWHSRKVFFGCHVQWITPESINERLPYYDYERQIAITADAIIDNRTELFERLQVNKSERTTITDSELILLAYLKWGKESPKYLIGDFAYMIWDERNQTLFGARDFSGARTLYYYKDHSRFTFCTILEPLLKLPYIKKKLNEEWLAEFIAIPTIIESVNVNNTVYKDIFQLPPSHTITIQNGKVSLERYWHLPATEILRLKSDEEYYEAFHEVFNLAVTEKLRTHGNVGAHLSGGLDSGSVVSFAAKALKQINKRLHTYSYIPEESFNDWTPKYYAADETPYIKETVGYVGNIKDRYLSFEDKNPLSEVDNFLDLLEMPYKFFENAYWLSGIGDQAQKDGVKIVLNGSRGNHSISWGSERLNIEYYASLLKKLRLFHLNRELTIYCQNFITGKKVILPVAVRNAFPKIANFFRKAEGSAYQFPAFINSTFAQKTNIYNKLQQYDIGISGNFHGDLNEYRKNYYNQLYVWNKSGTATTKMSLRYSLWDRDPTNDLRVIQFCLSIPEDQYVKNGMQRSFLRRATKGILPDSVRLNHYVRGIQAADTIHRMKDSWKAFVEELHQIKQDSAMANILDINVIGNILSKLEDQPSPNFVWTDEFKILTRSLIVYRFLKSF